MAKKFVRTITDTDIKKEPFHTNKQNDILSDDKDIYIRNKEEYHCLTDNIKTIKSDNEEVKISRYKNNATINIDFPSGGNQLSKIVKPLQVKEGVKIYKEFLKSYGYVTGMINDGDIPVFNVMKRYYKSGSDLEKNGLVLSPDIGFHDLDLVSLIPPFKDNINVKLSFNEFEDVFYNPVLILLQNASVYYGVGDDKYRNISVRIDDNSIENCKDGICTSYKLDYILTREGKKALPMDIELRPGETKLIKLDVGRSTWPVDGKIEIVGLMEEL